MERIILACSAGMSTSLVVSKMKKAASKRGVEYNIYAIPESSIGEELTKSSDQVLAILLGPQVRFMKKAAEKTAAPYGIPVDVIDPQSYGTADGDRILDLALQMAAKNDDK
ncbi:PTS sugar transporter subunit IIB [Peribacillus sp. FSL E2-0218]|uniref:PTS sugar transporter subunit IIB n=1 Tax=Peribacillus sp. FSL E2-0218 TaxID=2921364 RepID=UPI0030EDFABF